jgi:hypothetical protein
VAADLRPTVLPLARRALKRARKNGPGDPRVTALLGLVELADGHTAEAQALLESVAESADLPPLARFELAKLRYAATEAKLSVKATRFDAAQVAHIFSPLAPLRNNPPGDDGLIFGLIADTWSRAADQPNRDDLLQLAKSAPKFPKADRMLMQAATLCSAQDLKAEALALIEVGLGPKAPASSRAEFQKLKNEIAGGNSNSGAAAKGN